MTDDSFRVRLNVDLHPLVEERARVLESAGQIAQVLDQRWYHVWASSDYYRFAHVEEPTDGRDPSFTFGPEAGETVRRHAGYPHRLEDKSESVTRTLGYVLFDRGGDRDLLRALVDPSLVDLVDEVEPTGCVWGIMSALRHEP